MLLDFQFVDDGFDLLELRSLVGVCVPADVNDPLEMVVDGARDDRPGQLLCHLHMWVAEVSRMYITGKTPQPSFSLITGKTPCFPTQIMDWELIPPS